MLKITYKGKRDVSGLANAKIKNVSNLEVENGFNIRVQSQIQQIQHRTANCRTFNKSKAQANPSRSAPK